MFGVPETIKLETVAAREAVNALNLTQKDLRHLKREFDEIDVDQSGWCFGVRESPRDEARGGLLFDFEPVRTA